MELARKNLRYKLLIALKQLIERQYQINRLITLQNEKRRLLLTK